jgi:hypothetical protein
VLATRDQHSLFLMRLRIQTFSPLPELKAWYSTDHDPLSDTPLATVSHLKHAICLQLLSLKKFGVNGTHLVFFLDSFELLDESPLSVVRDGDLICVRALPSAQSVLLRKRKSAFDEGEQ